MNLELLNNDFKVSETPGLDTLDPRFADIVGMIQKGDFSGAASQSQEIIEEEIYDIRIICYFLYGFFYESGPGSLKGIFHSLEIVFRDNREAIGPSKNLTKHAKNSLVWMFKLINKILESEEKKKGEKWKAWQTDTSTDEIHDALEISQNLHRHFSEILEEQSKIVIDGLSRLTTWLDSFYKLIYKEPEPEPEEILETDSKVSPEQDNKKESITTENEPESGPSLKGKYNLPDGSESYPLQMLLKKLAAFEQLLKEDKNTGAALIANDVNRVIRNFDPQIYFPNLFKNFTRTYAINTEKLLAFDGCYDTAEWQSMEKLYNVDLESFVGLDNEFHIKDPDSFRQVENRDSHNESHDTDDSHYDNDDY